MAEPIHSHPPHRRWAGWLGLVLIVVLAGALRALGLEWVFLEDGVIFPPADPQYHARRAFFTFVNFPDVLLADPYINYPDGASVPWPPLFDFVLGGVARLLASSAAGFEVVVAWSGPVIGALTVVPIHLAGCRLASRKVGFCAGLFFALLPISINYSRIGNLDHHAAVCGIGAWLLYCLLALAEADVSRRRTMGLAVLLFVSQLALLLTWHGSLLYLGVVHALLLLAGAVTGRRAPILAQAGSTWATVVILIPTLIGSPTPLGGDYSAIALSWLHVLALTAAALVASVLWSLERRRPDRGPWVRGVWVVGASVGALAAILVLPGPRTGLAPALQFLTMSDGVGQMTGEQSPLFALFGRLPARPATLSWGYLAYLIPLAPAAAALVGRLRGAAPQDPLRAWLLALWGLLFGALSLTQRRYGNDFAPAASLLFGLLVVGVADAVTSHMRWPRWRRAAGLGLAVGLVLLLLWPPLARLHLPRAQMTWAALTGGPWPREQARSSIAATLTRFARDVRDVTPETSSFLGPGPAPEYGIIAHPNLGHALQYGARRATATDPFWAYIGQLNWKRTIDFLAANDELEALTIAQRLYGRYVVTTPDVAPRTVVHDLHRLDGSMLGSRGARRHFRLVAEAPTSGMGIGELFAKRRPGTVPYKLFEIVRGAVLELEATPGTKVSASLELLSSQGREFVYRTGGSIDSAGTLVLRLPYSTEQAKQARAIAPYRVLVGDERYDVQVSEASVLGGRKVRLQPAQ